MNGLPYYKRYPRDFIEGTIGMPFELKVTYSFVLDLIYMQGGNLPDDGRYIAGLLGVSLRKWASLREGLIEAGKIAVSGEFLTNYRAVSELETTAKHSRKQAENRSHPNKTNELQSPTSNHTDTEPDTEKKKPLTPKGERPSQNCVEAFEAYNATAAECGLPKADKLTKDRVRGIKARLDEYGLEGWMRALANIEKSSFLTGGNDRNWKANLNFLLQPSSFSKVHDGTYGNGRHRQQSTEPPKRSAQLERELQEMREFGWGQ